ncbi:hypothetical protein AB6A40_011050 [Gnathostoma spinigerum]|uniref:Uncharacterized protein n=1 Tax=Gnathostoma spinigerum TaxID=75299 RepID=A0ABD6F2A8_9BILA
MISHNRFIIILQRNDDCRKVRPVVKKFVELNGEHIEVVEVGGETIAKEGRKKRNNTVKDVKQKRKSKKEKENKKITTEVDDRKVEIVEPSVRPKRKAALSLRTLLARIRDFCVSKTRTLKRVPRRRASYALSARDFDTLSTKSDSKVRGIVGWLHFDGNCVGKQNGQTRSLGPNGVADATTNLPIHYSSTNCL